MVRQQAGGKNLKFKSSSSSTYSSAGLKCADNVEWTLKSSCIWARLSLASLFFWASLCHEMRKKHYRQELFPYELLSCFNRTGSVPTLLLYGQNTETPAERVTITCLSTDLETGPLGLCGEKCLTLFYWFFPQWGRGQCRRSPPLYTCSLFISLSLCSDLLRLLSAQLWAGNPKRTTLIPEELTQH